MPFFNSASVLPKGTHREKTPLKKFIYTVSVMLKGTHGEKTPSKKFIYTQRVWMPKFPKTLYKK